MNKYKVILADPPWETTAGPTIGKYKVVEGKQVFHNVNNKSRELSYPTMTVKEICSIPVIECAEKDCHLFLWVTNGHLPNAFDVAKSWGFNYSTTLVWCKNGGALGGTFRISTEFLIYCRRGSPKSINTTMGTWFNVKRLYENGYPKHSNKPYFFHELIEKTADGPYLEMFARRKRENWSVFGNEVENSINF